MSNSVHILRVIVLLHFAPHTQSTEPFYDITDPAFIKECIEEHNRHRANVKPSASNMRYMTWDEGLAISARAWARKCVFKHNPNLQQPGKMHPIFTPVGENIWAGTPYTKFKVQSAIQLWVDEDQYYNYDSNKCSYVCGHYTQVVWADTYKVGCAAQACQNGVAETKFSTVPGIIFVCNYATAGNYAGVSPYKMGKSCSSCSTETCENNLCRNSTRDILKNPAFIEECVKEHNRHRANVKPSSSNMRYMTWDEGLAISARAWARNCIFKHNPHLQQPGKMHPIFTPVGENLWVGAPYGSFQLQSAIKLWVDEDKYYNYDSNKCSKVCGHYTQVVWADTYKVGCAAQACQNGVAMFSSAPGIIFVCNYASAGNYAGASPYKKGTSCSHCGTETCENNLCRNSTRDILKRYNWRPDWDPALSACGSFCAALLVIRPVSIVLIFISVFCLQRFYPNLFIYE